MPLPEAAAVRFVQRRVLAPLLALGTSVSEDLLLLFREPPAGTLQQRWHVYAHGLVARAEEAVRNDFPALARVLGEGALRSLVARYLLRLPPRSHDLGRLGDRLPQFLDADALTRDLPFLPDLARLEWAVSEAFTAADASPLTWADVERLGPEAAIELPLAPASGVALVRSVWPIHEIWAQRDRPAAEIDVALTPRPRHVLVARRGLEIVCRPTTDIEAELLLTAAGGGSLLDLLDEEGTRAAALARSLRCLVEDGVFARPPHGPPAAGALSRVARERG